MPESALPHRQRLLILLRAWRDLGNTDDFAALITVIGGFVSDVIITECRNEIGAHECAAKWRAAIIPERDRDLGL
jgi:hypothetical protein